jgi:hypothetical protein
MSRLGSPNKSTLARRAEQLRTGKSMLEILVENARALAQVVERYVNDPTQANLDVVQNVIAARAVLSQVADRAAKYLHAPQMAVKHEHTMVDGKPVRPVIEITGYPAPVVPVPAPAPLPAPVVVVTDQTKH